MAPFLSPCPPSLFHSALPDTLTLVVILLHNKSVETGNKGGKRLTHKYKANRLLSSHRQLTVGEYQKWNRSWPWFGHLLMTRRCEISIITTWNLAMVSGGWSQSNICIWWPSLRMVPLGRDNTQCHSEWETDLCETKGKDNIQPLFFPLSARFWPTLSPSATAVVQNRAKHSCVEQTHSLCVSLVPLYYSLLRAFCCNFILQTRASRAESPSLMLFLMFGKLENATLGCSFSQRSGGMLQLSHIPTV